MIRYRELKNCDITKGAREYFNKSSISANNDAYIKPVIYAVLDNRLDSNSLYRAFWSALSHKTKNRFNKKKMIKFVNLCESTYKKYQIEKRKNDLNADFW